MPTTSETTRMYMIGGITSCCNRWRVQVIRATEKQTRTMVASDVNRSIVAEESMDQMALSGISTMIAANPGFTVLSSERASGHLTATILKQIPSIATLVTRSTQLALPNPAIP